MLTGQNVLIVEDQALIAMEIEGAITDAGARVVGIGGTVDAALALADDPSVTAAVVDLRLHGDSARPVIEKLAERKIPMIFYSGLDDTPTARNWPAVPVLSKPATSDKLVAMLSAVISG